MKTTIRINKYIANSGLCSRREADNFILMGLVRVNEKVITQLGYQVELTDKVYFENALISNEEPVYILLNKPKGFIASRSDKTNNKNVRELLSSQKLSPNTLPLDEMSRRTLGLVLLTNDELLKKKIAISNKHEILYHIFLNQPLQKVHFEKIKTGIFIKEHKIIPKEVAYVTGRSKKEIGIKINFNQIPLLAKIFKKFNYEIEQMDRVLFLNLTKKNLPRGHWRFLDPQEIRNLKMF